MGAQEKNVNRLSDAARTAAIGIAIAAFTIACNEPPPAAPPPPPEVYVADVIQQDVPVYLELVGQTQGFQDVEIRARVEGFLTNGELPGGLVRAARAPCSTRSTASRSRRSSPRPGPTRPPRKPRLAKANNDVTRYTPLVAKQAVSQQELDNALAAAGRRAVAGRGRQGRRREGDARSQLHADHVADQRAGRHDAGQGRQSRRPRREHAADDDLADRPDALPRRRHRGRLPARRRDAAPDGGDEAAPAEGIELTLADGTRVSPDRARSARSSAPSIRRPARSASSSLFPNPRPAASAGPVRPGAAAARHEARRAARAAAGGAGTAEPLQRGGGRTADNKVAFRTVKVGPRVDSLWVIEEGLKPGEQVVVEGLQRIQDGMTVTAKPAPRHTGDRHTAAAAARRSKPWPASSSTGRSSRW